MGKAKRVEGDVTKGQLALRDVPFGNDLMLLVLAAGITSEQQKKFRPVATALASARKTIAAELAVGVATRAEWLECVSALASLVSVVEQLIPEPSARGVADVVLFRARELVKRAVKS